MQSPGQVTQLNEPNRFDKNQISPITQRLGHQGVSRSQDDLSIDQSSVGANMSQDLLAGNVG
jgi:hypothetical protein